MELKDDAKPHNQRYYPMPHIYKNTFKKELDRLEEIGILEKVQESDWVRRLLLSLRKITRFGLFQTLGN